MLKFEKALYTSKQEVNSRSFCNLVHTGEIYHIFAYTVWYDWQLKFCALRQNRKLDDGEAKRGRNVRNQLLTKSPLCSCAWVKLATLTSPRASRAFDKAGKLLLPAWVWRKIALVRSHILHWETQISWKLWGWIYHGSKWFKSMVYWSQSFLEEKLPGLHRICPVAFQCA